MIKFFIIVTMMSVSIHGYISSSSSILFYSKHLFESIYKIQAGKSQMPKFDENDEAELANIINNNQQRIKKPIISKNNNPNNNASKPTTSEPNKPNLKLLSEIYFNEFDNQKMPSSSSTSKTSNKDSSSFRLEVPEPQSIPPLVKPNNDWRNVKSDVNPVLYKTTQQSKPLQSQLPNRNTASSAKLNKSPSSAQKYTEINSEDYFSFTDLDYDDFEAAMREEENGDMGVKANKISKPVVVHQGLHSGDQIPTALFNNNLVISTDGSKCELKKLLRPQSEFLLIFSDPRRLTDDFKNVLKQFGTIPLTSTKLTLLAINCDDLSDQKKFLKKINSGNGIPMSSGYPSFTALTDPTKKYMSKIKCREEGSVLKSSLMLLQPQSDYSACVVLKVWYENDFDVIEIKDMIVDEINSYSKNPQIYIQSQIGIR